MRRRPLISGFFPLQAIPSSAVGLLRVCEKEECTLQIEKEKRKRKGREHFANSKGENKKEKEKAKNKRKN